LHLSEQPCLFELALRAFRADQTTITHEPDIPENWAAVEQAS
jgi:hypothetical protein